MLMTVDNISFVWPPLATSDESESRGSGRHCSAMQPTTHPTNAF